MNTILARRLAAIILAGIAALAGPSCAKKDQGADAWSGYGADGAHDGNIPLPRRDENYSFYGPGSGNVNKSQFTPVYFRFDSFAIDAGERSKVSQVAEFLRGGSGNLLVAGFTDQVGTEEYNRVLGERRALAVREAIIGSGVDSSRIQTVSFGEDMPADPGNDALNRRAEFGVVR